MLMWLSGVAILIIFLLVNRKSKEKLPPGPPSLPLIGSLFSLIWADPRKPAIAFEKFAKKYGSIFSIKLGPSFIVVVLNSHQEIVKAIATEALLSRSDENDTLILEKTEGKALGLIFSMPDVWAETRAYSHRILRKYGFSTKSKMESIVVEEAVDFCEEIKQSMVKGQTTLTLRNQLDPVFFNIAWTILTGKKYEADDNTTRRLLEAMHTVAQSIQFGAGIDKICPKLLRIFPKWTGFANLQKHYRAWKKCYEDVLNEVRMNGEYLQNPQSFLQEFLQKVDTSTNRAEDPLEIYTEANLIAVLQDIAIAGTDTQSHTMKFLIRYLIYNPRVQVKLQEEVDRVIGANRRVNVDDTANLVYLQATLYELYRIARVLPLIPRKLLQDWEYGPYRIPKGASILLNVWTANMDESVWINPNEFSPERFISKDGTLINTDKILSFGLGKRRCIGEQVAKTSMILVTATLIQEFSFHCDPVTGPPIDEYLQGIDLDPVPFNVLIKTRASQQSEQKEV